MELNDTFYEYERYKEKLIDSHGIFMFINLGLYPL